MDRVEGPTKASTRLVELFKDKRSGAQKICSARTGIDQSRLSKMASGKAFPRADEAVEIERAAGIPVSWWAEPADGEEATTPNASPGKAAAQ